MTKPLTNRQQYWLQHIRDAEASSSSLIDYARQHDLSTKALYNAKSVLKKKGLIGSAAAPSPFVPVDVMTPAPSSKGSTWEAVLPNGIRLQLSTDAQLFPSLLEALYRL